MQWGMMRMGGERARYGYIHYKAKLTHSILLTRHRVLTNFVGGGGKHAVTTIGGTTSTAVLPIYENGGRGCFFTPGVNGDLTSDELIAELERVEAANVRCFIFGYPHLLMNVVDGIGEVFRASKAHFGNGVITCLDFNGVNEKNAKDVKLENLGDVDIVHLNEDELRILSDTGVGNVDGGCDVLFEHGVKIVGVTMGKSGSYVKASQAERSGPQPKKTFPHT